MVSSVHRYLLRFLKFLARRYLLKPPSLVKPPYRSGQAGNLRKRSQDIASRLQKKILKGEQAPSTPIRPDLKENLQVIKECLGSSGDLIIREFKIALNARGTAREGTPKGRGEGRPINAAILYFDGMVDKKLLNENVLEPLMIGSRFPGPPEAPTGVSPIQLVESYLLTISEVKEGEKVEDALAAILEGDTALLVDGEAKALLISTKGWEHRSVQQPQSESLIRGPRESFIEILRPNLALLRRKIKSPLLTVEIRKVGRLTQTDLALVYIRGVANQEVLNEVKKRLEKVDIDGVLESGYIEEIIEDAPWSPFPTVQYTERPDKLAANLLEGRIGIMVDGSPMALMVPAVFAQFLQSPEDYYERFMIGSAIRFIRLLGIFVALTLPSLYIALTTFHHEMIPTRLLLSIAATREPVPFPAVVEAFIMELSLELLREASVRLPGPVGNTIGIVGALILGEAAIRAGLVSPAMVIVVAVTAIGSFTVPTFSAAIPLRLIRFPLMLLAAALGLYGVMLGWLAVLIHITSLKSFGVPYLAPAAPARIRGMKDLLLRAPLWSLGQRPRFLRPLDLPRQGDPLRNLEDKGGNKGEGEEGKE